MATLCIIKQIINCIKVCGIAFTCILLLPLILKLKKEESGHFMVYMYLAAVVYLLLIIKSPNIANIIPNILYLQTFFSVILSRLLVLLVLNFLKVLLYCFKYVHPLLMKMFYTLNLKYFILFVYTEN